MKRAGACRGRGSRGAGAKSIDTPYRPRTVMAISRNPREEELAFPLITRHAIGSRARGGTSVSSGMVSTLGTCVDGYAFVVTISLQSIATKGDLIWRSLATRSPDGSLPIRQNPDIAVVVVRQSTTPGCETPMFQHNGLRHDVCSNGAGTLGSDTSQKSTRRVT